MQWFFFKLGYDTLYIFFNECNKSHVGNNFFMESFVVHQNSYLADDIVEEIYYD